MRRVALGSSALCGLAIGLGTHADATADGGALGFLLPLGVAAVTTAGLCSVVPLMAHLGPGHMPRRVCVWQKQTSERWRGGRVLTPSRHGHLFDHLVGAKQDRGRHFNAERLRGLEVDYQLHLCRLLDRQIGGLFAVENAADISPRKAIPVGNV